jgi:hypothetical protein
MAKFRLLPTVDVSGYFTAKVKGAIKDVDIRKPVRLAVDMPDTYQLAADGEAIDAFIVAIDPATSDGKALCTLNGSGRIRCKADGALTIGALVEAAANAAAGTANTGGLPIVSAKAVVGADLTAGATGAQIAAAVNAILAEAQLSVPAWRVVSGTTADGAVADADVNVIIERII